MLVASGDLLAARSARRFAVLAGPALALGAVTLALFPEKGYEPFGLGSLLAALGAGGVVLLLAPPSERLIRCTALLYVLALLVDYVVRSPMGSNAVRFGILFAPAALAACVKGEDLKRVIAWARSPSRSQQATSHGATGGRVHSVLVAMLGVALVLWQVNGPIDQSVGAADDPTSHPSFYSPVIAYLDRRAAGAPMRIEVPFTKSHWDATILGDHFALARGWDRQLDTSDNAIFYERGLTAPVYRAWLSENAVRFVALSDASLDFSSVQEAALIRAGLPFLRQVFASRNWHVYEVLARGAARERHRYCHRAQRRRVFSARRACRTVGRARPLHPLLDRHVRTGDRLQSSGRLDTGQCQGVRQHRDRRGIPASALDRSAEAATALDVRAPG